MENYTNTLIIKTGKNSTGSFFPSFGSLPLRERRAGAVGGGRTRRVRSCSRHSSQPEAESTAIHLSVTVRSCSGKC